MSILITAQGHVVSGTDRTFLGMSYFFTLSEHERTKRDER